MDIRGSIVRAHCPLSQSKCSSLCAAPSTLGSLSRLFCQFLAWCEAMQRLGGPGGPGLQSLRTPLIMVLLQVVHGLGSVGIVLRFRRTSQHNGVLSACHDFLRNGSTAES